MEAAAHFQSVTAGNLDSGERAAHRPGWTVERADEPVSRALHDGPAKAVDLASQPIEEAFEKENPAPVAHRRDPFGGTDDVDEDDGGEHPVRITTCPVSRHEVLDLTQKILGVDEEQLVGALELDILGAGDVRRQVATMVGPDVVEVAAVNDERWRRHPGSTRRTSMRLMASCMATAAPGPAASRSKWAHHDRSPSSANAMGLVSSRTAPVPQREPELTHVPLEKCRRYPDRMVGVSG